MVLSEVAHDQPLAHLLSGADRNRLRAAVRVDWTVVTGCVDAPQRSCRVGGRHLAFLRLSLKRGAKPGPATGALSTRVPVATFTPGGEDFATESLPPNRSRSGASIHGARHTAFDAT